MTLAFHEGVLAQPGNLRVGAAAMRERLADTDLAPLREGTLVLSGIGASWHALAPVLGALRAAGRRAFGVTPGALTEGLGDAHVIVSQSGRSRETLAAIERLDPATVFAISADGASPIARRAGVWLPLGDVPDTPLSTLGYTATLQALGLLADAIVGVDAAGAWARLPDLAAEVLAGSDGDARALAERLAAVRSLDAVGGGVGAASAGATALLVREGLRLPATGEETRQYLHGPLEAVDETVGGVLFGGDRELALAAEMASYGAPVTFVGEQTSSSVPVITVPRVRELAAPILEILPVQLAVHHVAQAKGLPLSGLTRPQDDTKQAAA